jgi:D-alanyl-D-alanine dipeptidase
MINSLVTLSAETHDIVLDLVYATSNNIAGKPVYQRHLCLLHRDAEVCLRKAVRIASQVGCRLKIFDAFRPQEAQLILVDAKGDELDMGTGFDHMTLLSHHFSDQVSPQAQTNRNLLMTIMEGAGFQHIPQEWWHYELPQHANYHLIDSISLGNLNPMLHSGVITNL